jgi:hypothetical protein
MDYTTIIIATAGIAALVGLAWLGGYQHATNSASREINLDAVLEDINKRKPKSAKSRRKAARKAVRA